MIKWKYSKDKRKKNDLERTYLFDIQLLKSLFDKNGSFKCNSKLFKKWDVYIDFLENN